MVLNSQNINLWSDLVYACIVAKLIILSLQRNKDIEKRGGMLWVANANEIKT